MKLHAVRLRLQEFLNILQGNRCHLIIMHDDDDGSVSVLPFLCAVQPKNFLSSLRMCVFLLLLVICNYLNFNCVVGFCLPLSNL